MVECGGQMYLLLIVNDAVPILMWRGGGMHSAEYTLQFPLH